MRAFKVAAATVGLSAALVGVAAGPASAAPACAAGYPAAQCTVSVSDSRVVVGQTVTFSASGFGANEMVTVTLNQGNKVVVIGQFQANAQGVVSGSFKVPSVKPGRYALTVTGDSSRGAQSVALNVLPNGAAAGTASNSSDPSSLAFTGSDAAKTAGAGAVLLLGGGALIVAARRRKHVNAAA